MEIYVSLSNMQIMDKKNAANNENMSSLGDLT